MATKADYAKHSGILWGFRYSDKESMEVDYDSIENATRAQCAMLWRLRYHKIHDVIIKRRKSRLYLMRNKEVLKNND